MAEADKDDAPVCGTGDSGFESRRSPLSPERIQMVCLIVGDSIAVGTGSVQHECSVRAKVGASANFIVNNYSASAKSASEYVVISMGSNDPTNPHNAHDALKLRSNIAARKVVWILPYNRTAANVMRRVAERFGDTCVDLAPQVTADGVHPRSYQRLHRRVKMVL